MKNKFYEVDMAYVKNKTGDFGSAHMALGMDEDKVVLAISVDEEIDDEDLQDLMRNLANRKDVKKLKLNMKEDLLVYLSIMGKERDIKSYLG